MAKYERFEQLPVWQAAMDLAEKAYRLVEHRAFARLPELKDQMRRAALSVSNNIAEGFERGTTAEPLALLYIARGSASEVRSMLHFCERLVAKQSESSDLKSQISNSKSEISNLRSQISDLKSLAESCSRQIRGWADHLQNSDIEGQRRLTEATRGAWDAARRREAFLAKLQAIRDSAAPQPRDAD